ncbi:MAG TPA: hypothetical protein VFO86_10750, partial [Terriglobia bacterium]|nr:hypothetical protein [Terriglobia bacterium]
LAAGSATAGNREIQFVVRNFQTVDNTDQSNLPLPAFKKSLCNGTHFPSWIRREGAKRRGHQFT